jgi:hypothetical protein
MNYINQPVSVSVPNEEGGTYNVSFHESKGLGIPQSLHLGAEATSMVNSAALKIRPYEKAIQQWIGQSPDNAMLFLTNPIQAMQTAGIGIPEEILSEVQATSNHLVQSLKK